MPCIMQCFVKRPEDVERGLEFDRKLYVARRVFEQSNDNTYVVSFSSRTIVYKGNVPCRAAQTVLHGFTGS